MQLHETSKHGNVFLTWPQICGLWSLLEIRSGVISENEGAYLNYDHDAGVLTFDDGGDPWQIDRDGEAEIYGAAGKDTA
jgi:hypothetical protein